MRTPAGGHDFLGERLGTLDARGVLRRAEAGDPRGPYRVGHAEHQRHLGPMTTRSAPIRWASLATASPEVMSTSYWSAMIAVPALPGAMATSSTSGSCRIASSNACSRAPDPITRTRTTVNPIGSAAVESRMCRRVGYTLGPQHKVEVRTTTQGAAVRARLRLHQSRRPQKGIPVAEFAELRKTAPVWWNEQPESIFDDGGYWVISRHEDIKTISRDGDLWSTNRKGVVMRMPDGTTPDQLELTKALLINHDAPDHTRLRKLVSGLFTPRAVAALEEKLAGAARDRRRRKGRRRAATSSTTSR